MYAAVIKEVLAETHPSLSIEPRLIEGYLRLKYGCLDALSREDFKKEILEIVEVVLQGRDEADELASSYGL